MPLDRVGQLDLVVRTEPYGLELSAEQTCLLVTAGHHNPSTCAADLINQVNRPDRFFLLVQEKIHRVKQDDRHGAQRVKRLNGADEVLAPQDRRAAGLWCAQPGGVDQQGAERGAFGEVLVQAPQQAGFAVPGLPDNRNCSF